MEVGQQRVFLRCYDVRGHDVSELDRAKPLKKINPVPQLENNLNRGDDRGNTPLVERIQLRF